MKSVDLEVALEKLAPVVYISHILCHCDYLFTTEL